MLPLLAPCGAVSCGLRGGYITADGCGAAGGCNAGAAQALAPVMLPAAIMPGPSIAFPLLYWVASAQCSAAATQIRCRMLAVVAFLLQLDPRAVPAVRFPHSAFAFLAALLLSVADWPTLRPPFVAGLAGLSARVLPPALWRAVLAVTKPGWIHMNTTESI